MTYSTGVSSLNELLDDQSISVVTRSGKRLHPFNPNPADLDINDLAWSLSRQNRWGGHQDFAEPCKLDKHNDSTPLNVAQHSVMVSKLAAAVCPEAEMWGLAHDLTEGLCGDIMRPIKSAFPLIERGEHHCAQILRETFDIPYNDEIAETVDAADRIMAFHEAKVLFTDHRLWTDEFKHEQPAYDDIYTVDRDFHPWTPSRAREEFLYAFHAASMRVDALAA